MKCEMDCHRALKLSDEIIADAHAVLAEYVHPEGIREKEAIVKLLNVLTGPRHLHQMHLTRRVLEQNLSISEPSGMRH